jgi:hypothetical protein
VPPLLGMLLVFYYPLISLGGYTLSEIPFAVFLLAASHALLRLVQDGRSRDAWLAGVYTAIATVFRPQILMSIAVFAVVWLLLRGHMKARLKHLVFAAIPVAVVLACSAARLYHHTGRLGIISENGRFNALFGRCHNTKAFAHPRSGRGPIHFGPPPLLQLEKRAVRAPNSWVQLNPAIGVTLRYDGYIADEAPLRELKRKCVAATGYLGQLQYAAVNVLMLGGYNVPLARLGHEVLAAPRRAVAARVFGGGRVAGAADGVHLLPAPHGRAPRVLALHIWALIVTAAIYFGDTRMRAPYDPMLLLLAIEAYAIAGGAIAGRVRRGFRRG